MRILVAGANGFVGSHLIPALAADHEVIALDLEPYDGPAQTVVGDLTEYESFADALEGVDMAFYLVHSMGQGKDFQELEQTCAQNFRRALDAHDVDRVCYLTGIVHHREDLSGHLDSRTQVGEILAGGTADLTQLRAAIILGRESASFRIMYQLVDRLPVMIAPDWLDSLCQPIHIDDIVAYLQATIDTEETRGRTFEVGGPDIMTYEEMLEQLGAVNGRRPRIVTLPLPFPTLSWLWLRLVTDLPSGLISALVQSLQEDMTVQDSPIDAVIDHDCTDFRTACRKILQD